MEQRTDKIDTMPAKGFSLVEMAVAIFILAILSVAIARLSTLGVKTAVVSEQRTVAQAIANERLETIYAMPYEDVGVEGGVGAMSAGAAADGVLREIENVIRNNNQEYEVRTFVTLVDDPVNGKLADPITEQNADYKVVEVRVRPARSGQEIVISSLVTSDSNRAPVAPASPSPSPSPSPFVPPPGSSPSAYPSPSPSVAPSASPPFSGESPGGVGNCPSEYHLIGHGGNNNAASVFAVDMDRDGDVDAAIGSGIDNRGVSWFRNNGNDTFGKNVIAATEEDGYVQSVVAADMDNDGDIDLAYAADLHNGEFDSQLVWMENNGNQSFARRSVVQSPGQGIWFVNKVIAVDIDKNSTMDLVALDTWGFGLWKNDGHQSFSRQYINPDGGLFSDLFVVDMDGDGDSDIVLGSELDASLYWMENDGHQNFTQHKITDDAEDIKSVAAADMDNDGDMDIVSGTDEHSGPGGAHTINNELSWWENEGNNNFTKHLINKEGAGLKSVAAADMDNDGDMDIVSGSDYDSEVAWLENDGSQNFTRHIVTTQSKAVQSIALVDMDNDGFLEIVSGGNMNDEVAWMEICHEVLAASSSNNSGLAGGGVSTSSASPESGFWARMLRTMAWWR